MASRRAREDILTLNAIRGSFQFTAAEKTQEADAQLNQTLLDLEERIASQDGTEASGEDRVAYILALMKRSFKKAKKRLWAEAIEDWQKIIEIDPTHQRAKNSAYVWAVWTML